MNETFAGLMWRQLRERIRLLNRYSDSRPPRQEARALADRQRQERRIRRQP